VAASAACSEGATVRDIAEPLTRLVEELEKLPGIGARTAERLAFHLLKATTDDAMQLARAIRDVKQRLAPCPVCFNVAEGGAECRICTSAARDRAKICVVEQPKDLIAIEATGAYDGLYHVLMGHVSPHEGASPDSLTLTALVERVRAARAGATPVAEVIVATNMDAEGDLTAMVLGERLAPFGVTVTRLARGLPSGGAIEFANVEILKDALQGRS